MNRARLLEPLDPAAVHPLPGLEVDNLLAILALLGLLRAIETAEPDWRPRASWAGPPWVARLHLAEAVSPDQVAARAAQGIETIASQFDVDDRADVNFERDEFRDYASRNRLHPIRSALVTALSAEHPQKRDGGLKAAPLVMMFGQGHQHFLERLVKISLGESPKEVKKDKKKRVPSLRDPWYIAEALFHPWKREDDTDAFRWDPEEDQRYALRFGEPSKAGAASTVHGANRLAAVGLLSFPCVPAVKDVKVPGANRHDGGIVFVWPVWSEALSLAGIHRLMSHPEVIEFRRTAVRPLGVAEIYVARRVNYGQIMNVTRAVPRAERRKPLRARRPLR